VQSIITGIVGAVVVPPVQQPTEGDGPIKGQDIYGGDDVNSWADAVASGLCKFCIMKAVEGMGAQGSYAPRMAAARAAGVPILGAYAFFHPGEDPVAQAEFFVNTAKAGNPDFLALDWETTDGVGATTDKANALIFLKKIHELTGKKPFVYLSPGWAGDMGGLSSDFAQYPLWIAHYGVKKPTIPAPWTSYVIWQYGSDAVKGLNEGQNSTDGDVSPYSVDQLKTYIAAL